MCAFVCTCFEFDSSLPAWINAQNAPFGLQESKWLTRKEQDKWESGQKRVRGRAQKESVRKWEGREIGFLVLVEGMQIILQLSSLTPSPHVVIVKEGAMVLSAGWEWNQKEVCAFQMDEERLKTTVTKQISTRAPLYCMFVLFNATEMLHKYLIDYLTTSITQNLKLTSGGQTVDMKISMWRCDAWSSFLFLLIDWLISLFLFILLSRYACCDCREQEVSLGLYSWLNKWWWTHALHHHRWALSHKLEFIKR